MMWEYGHGATAAATAWWVIMVLMVVLIVIGIVLLVRGTAGRSASSQGGVPQASMPPLSPPAETGARSETPLQTLEMRYARGEIDREEFLQRRDDLRGTSV